MKKLLAILLCALSFNASAATCDNIFQQLDPFGNQLLKLVAVPSGCTGANGIFVYDVGAQQAKMYTIDSTLKYTGAVLGVDTSALPVIPFNFGMPSTRTLALATDYQAGAPTKAAVISVSPSCSAALSLSGGATCTMEARISLSTLNCSGGTVVATWTNGNTGTLTVGLNTLQTIGAPADIKLPAGGHFILCATSGSPTIVTAVDQAAG